MLEQPRCLRSGRTPSGCRGVEQFDDMRKQLNGHSLRREMRVAREQEEAGPGDLSGRPGCALVHIAPPRVSLALSKDLGASRQSGRGRQGGVRTSFVNWLKTQPIELSGGNSLGRRRIDQKLRPLRRNADRRLSRRPELDISSTETRGEIRRDLQIDRSGARDFPKAPTRRARAPERCSSSRDVETHDRVNDYQRVSGRRRQRQRSNPWKHRDELREAP